MSALDWLSKAKGGIDMVSICITAIETIATVLRHATSKDQKLQTIEDVIHNVQAGWKGEMKPDAIRAEFEKMKAAGQSADAAADAAADAKYGPKP